MTINQLIKKLEKIQEKVGKRRKVVVELESFQNLDDQYSHWEASDADYDVIPMISPDGGVTSERVVVVIK